MELELCLEPDDAARLTRLPMLAPLKAGKARSRALRILWHDSPGRDLAAAGLALVEQGTQWRLERLRPDHESWLPGAVAPILAAGRDAADIDYPRPEQVLIIAAFDGRATKLELAAEPGSIALTLLNGTARGLAGEQRISRVRLAGGLEAVQSLACTLAGELRLKVPRISLAAEALAAASHADAQPGHEGAPQLPAGVAVRSAFAHVVGHLTDVILYLAPAAAKGQDGPEPVHQMRVAVRRLRSAIKVFGPAVDGPAVQAADAGLKTLAIRLAPTRDWDVLVTETLAEVASAFPTDDRLTRLLAAAERRRLVCHDDLRSFLTSAEFRRLGIELACLAHSQHQPSAGEADGSPPALDEFAATVLNKRLKKLLHADGELAELPPKALHSVRLRAKRLRYAAEIFAPLYDGKGPRRFLERLSRLQDRLGAMNDGAVAASLLNELSGRHLAFATGLAVGFTGAHGSDTRDRIETAWRKFRKVRPFWL